MQYSPPLEVKVWGEFACFTRPEMKVERVSYPVMTPSAARGALEAVFWKPEFAWQVREIWVLKEIRTYSILRNEVANKASYRAAVAAGSAGGGFSVEEWRTQRHTLALRDVAYVIKADMALTPRATDDVAKYRDQFRRRVQRGQCYHRPYLGCREFACEFGPPENADRPIDLSLDLGIMLFDLDYVHNAQGLGIGANPRFFPSRLEHGILNVPPDLYQTPAKGG